MTCKVINLEINMPTADYAITKLSSELRTARATRVPAMKIIHGYGSSGKGGKIKNKVYRFLLEKKSTGEIREVIKGEDFSPFDQGTRNALVKCPFLSKDSDMAKLNHGITIVIL